MSQHPVIVIGAGITGAFASYFLARLGHPVVLVERDDVAIHASGNNPGGLNPLHGPGALGSTLPLAAFALHRSEFANIRELSGHAIRMNDATRIHLAMDDEDRDRLEALSAVYASTRGFAARTIDNNELRLMEPRLSPAIRFGVETRGDARVSPKAYATAVVDAAKKLGCRLVKGEVRGLTREGSRVTRVLCDSGDLRCDGVVLATGPWTSAPGQWIGEELPVVPVKGELIQIASSPALRHDFVWRDAAVYCIDGDVWLGGTMERAGFDAAPNPERARSIVERVSQFLPSLNNAHVLRHTAALRPATPDGLPIVGLAREAENVCLALGGGQKGMLLGSLIAQSAARILMSGGAEGAIAAWSPDRFNS